MKLFKIIGRHPMLSIAILTLIILMITPIMIALFISTCVVLPMYLTVQLFYNKD
jgi:hypothetical protein|tara:strand:+ start:2730 stop:2891 length:162 start_codon:yes stop_codon:yes gene_type:complete